MNALAALVAALALAAAPALAQPRICSRDEASAAERSATALQSWTEVYDAYRRYGHCDDGAIGEGFSGSVVKLLARWERFEALHGLALADAGFRAFVIRHVDATALEHDLKTIIANSTERCRADAQPFCVDLKGAADAAIRQIRE